MSKSITVNDYGFNPYLKVDVKAYYSQQEWVYTLCWIMDVKVYYRNKNTLFFADQYVFISSMNEQFNDYFSADQVSTCKFVFSWTIIHYYFVFCVYK